LFGILGPLQIGGPGSTSSAGSPRQQAVLAVLLAHANTMVPIDALIEEAWNGRPPPSARRAVHVYVFRLRRMLAAYIGEPSHDVLATSEKGYLLRVGPSQLDATRFRQLLTDGHQALLSGRAVKAGVLLTEALALWRGPALAGVAVESVQQSLVIPLEELRLSALQTKIKAALELGQHEAVVAELWALVAAHPYREAFRAHLMVALYRCGRQAEALTVYDQARRQLREEFGADPGVALQRLHHAVLRGDPELAALSRPGDSPRRPVHPVDNGSRPVPAQAPRVTHVFAGRGAELAKLEDIAAEVRAATSIVLLHGGAGVGKTALAVRFAHLFSQRFADGQLFADLRGFDAHRSPATPDEVLSRFLRALGADSERMGADLDEQSALFRSLMADRQMLIVLDNAGHADQVRPLLPGRSSSLVVVTCRNILTSLVAVDGAQPVPIDVLSEQDAVALLAGVLGERVAADPIGAAELVRLCACLPLALRIAASVVLGRPELKVGDLVAELSCSNPLLGLTVSGQ